MDIIGADLVALYPEHYAHVAMSEKGREMPSCPLCETGDCVHNPTEDEMSARNQQTENKSAKPTGPDPFEGKYEMTPDGAVRFTQEVVFDVPTAGGARTKVLVAPVGMVRPMSWLDQKRDYYGLSAQDD